MRSFALALALFASSAAAEDAANVEPPAWVKKPDYEKMRSVWPRDALMRGQGGKATLECIITTRGLLEGCTVISETPEGAGFGAAALQLTPSFLLKPSKKDGKPIQTSIRIPVSFEGGWPISRVDLSKTPLVTEPVWEQAPSFVDMAAAWPQSGKAEFGHVSMRCDLTEEGRLRGCEVESETPLGQGFGRAATKVVAPKFKLRVAPGDGPQVAKASIILPIRFNPSIDPSTPRAIVKPRWITQLDPQKIAEIYPDAAAQAGVKSGRGVADCLVDANGRLTDCKPAKATPEGLGFSEAAVKVASIMIMNPWSDGGGPVDGVRLKLPITFNLAPEQEAEPATP